MTPPPTPPRVAPEASAPAPRDTAGATCPPGPFRIRAFQQNLGYIQIYPDISVGIFSPSNVRAKRKTLLESSAHAQVLRGKTDEHEMLLRAGGRCLQNGALSESLFRSPWCPHPSSPVPTCSDTGGDDTSSPPYRAEGPAATAVMPEVADTGPGVAEMQTTRSRTRADSPAYTPLARYGPWAPTIPKSQLRRKQRSICTLCQRSQRVSAYVEMCPNTCPCPLAVRPAAQPGRLQAPSGPAARGRGGGRTSQPTALGAPFHPA